MKENVKKILIIAALSLMLIVVVFSSGCIKMIAKTTSGSQNSIQSVETTGINHEMESAFIPPPQSIKLEIQTTLISDQQSSLVTEVPPIVSADEYPVIHGQRINQTPEFNRLNRKPEYTKTYTLRGNATGLLVNVVKGPLLIMFDVNPMYDCLESPASCRGNKAKSINRPFFICTVRNNETHEIMAEDGYGREYSSQKTDREIRIFGEGQYHLTLSGNYLDITLSIMTGQSPITMDVSGNQLKQQSTPFPPEEEE